MREIQLKLPELLLVGVTRGMLGAGIGLLLSGKFTRDRRVAIGCTLATIGILTTIPIAMRAFGRHRALSPDGRPGMTQREPPMVS